LTVFIDVNLLDLVRVTRKLNIKRAYKKGPRPRVH